MCALLLIGVCVVAIFAGSIAPYAPNQNHPADRLQGPSAAYWLGTDNFGRDVFSRIVYGARLSIQVGFISMIVGSVLAMTVGVTAAYFRGPYDFVVGRIVDLVQSLPSIMLLITLLAIVGRSERSIGLVLGLTSGVIGSRVTRGAALAVVAQPFIEVSRSVGCGPFRIVLRHVLPNVVPVVMVLATINVGAAIIAEASLSFINYGVPPPAPSWGSMLSRDGRAYMVQAPWLFWAPTLALAVVVFSVNMLGDALRDGLDPRLRGR